MKIPMALKLAAATFWSAVLLATAQAQTAPAASNEDTQTVTVTANRRAEEQQKVSGVVQSAMTAWAVEMVAPATPAPMRATNSSRSARIAGSRVSWGRPEAKPNSA